MGRDKITIAASQISIAKCLKFQEEAYPIMNKKTYFLSEHSKIDVPFGNLNVRKIILIRSLITRYALVGESRKSKETGI
jgi:hypothetical protein